MPQVLSFTNSGADWQSQKIIDLVSGTPSFMAIGEGDGTDADADYSSAQLNELQSRVAATKSHPGTRLTQWTANFSLAAESDLGGFAVTIGGTQDTEDLFAVMTFDQVLGVPLGTAISVTIRGEQRA